MNVINLESPNLIIVENFLSKDEIDTILLSRDFHEKIWSIDFESNYPNESNVDPALWYSVKQWDGMCIDLQKTLNNDLVCLDNNFYIDLPNRIKQFVVRKFGVDTLRVEQYLLNRWRVGRSQAPHLDYFVDNDREHDYKMLERNGLPRDFIDSFKGMFKTKHYSSLVYLNTDYEGGELYFPQYNNFSIKPSPGTLVCFKGDENSLHGVNQVTSGTRYTISVFWEDIEYLAKINSAV